MLINARDAWGAKYSIGYAMPAGAKAVVVAHHAYRPDVAPTATPEFERASMREDFERYHVTHLFDSRPWHLRHIGYNHVVFPSGRVYEGVGWGRVGAHAPGMNSSSYGICIAMDAQVHPPTAAAVRSFREVVAEGLRLGHIAKQYHIDPHSKYKATSCPGKYLEGMLDQLRPSAQPLELPTLKEGATGEHVARLQTLLGMPAGTTPRFGPLTRAAVERFQRANALKVDGTVGPATWAALLRSHP